MTECALIDCREVSDAQYASLLESVSDSRRDLANSYRLRSDSVMSAVAGYCMKLLEDNFGCEIVIEPESRKPLLTDFIHHFNVSHSGGYVAVAWSELPVGVDVQTYIADPAVADRILTRNESVAYSSSDDPSFLTRLWTRKESYLKLTGDGLSTDPRTLEVLDDDGIMACPMCAKIHELRNGQVCLCVSHLDQKCRIREISFQQLLDEGLVV